MCHNQGGPPSAARRANASSWCPSKSWWHPGWIWENPNHLSSLKTGNSKVVSQVGAPSGDACFFYLLNDWNKGWFGGPILRDHQIYKLIICAHCRVAEPKGCSRRISNVPSNQDFVRPLQSASELRDLIVLFPRCPGYPMPSQNPRLWCRNGFRNPSCLTDGLAHAKQAFGIWLRVPCILGWSHKQPVISLAVGIFTYPFSEWLVISYNPWPLHSFTHSTQRLGPAHHDVGLARAIRANDASELVKGTWTTGWGGYGTRPRIWNKFNWQLL